jgi:hypothetical protein
MNLRAKLVYSIGLLGLLWLMLPSPLRADTTYSYAGNVFTSCGGNWYPVSATTCQGAVNLSFETSLTGSQLYGLSNDDITNTLIYGDAVDGNPYTGPIHCGFPCAPVDLFLVEISTNATGDIIAWSISATNINDGADVTDAVTTSNYGDSGATDQAVPTGICGAFVSCVGYGTVSVPGTWSGPIPTPEPKTSDVALVGIGFVLMLMVKRKRMPTAYRRAVERNAHDYIAHTTSDRKGLATSG